MKIQIKHISNTLNYGSAMMGISLINKLNRNLEVKKIYVDAVSKNDLERLKYETNCKNIERSSIYQGKNIIGKVINKIRREIIESKIDTVIVIGGDDISEYYGIKNLESILKHLEYTSRKKNTILLGQTMGPFTDNRKELARKSLEKTKIYTRDNNCFEYLKSLKFTNIKNSRDLAFIELPNQKKTKYILDKYKLKKEEYITFVPSGLTKCYTKEYDDYLNENINIIRKIIEKQKLEKKNIVLLPHVLSPISVDDRKVIRDIVKGLDKGMQSRIVAIDDAMLPSEAREILSNGIFTITGRMHAAVSTFYMRKPAICLSYSVKYKGVIGDGLDMNELVIESDDEKLWKESKISKLVNEKVDFVLENYENLIDKIDVNVSSTSSIVEEQLNDLIKGLKK